MHNNIHDQSARSNHRLLTRRPEVELMSDPQHAEAYANADFSAAHQSVVEWIKERYGTFPPGTKALDIGCGPGDITRRLLKAQPHLQVIGIDGSNAMLKYAQRLTEEAGLSKRVTYSRLLLQELPHKLVAHDISFVICTSVLHHLPNPLLLWTSLAALSAATKRLEIVVTDLIRPKSEEEAHMLVEQLVGKEHPTLKEDFFNSLCAAFTIEEVGEQIHAANHQQLKVEQIDELHLVVSGAVGG